MEVSRRVQIVEGVKIINWAMQVSRVEQGEKEKREEKGGGKRRSFRDGAPLIRVGRGRCLVFPVIKTLPGMGENEDQDRDIKYLAIIFVQFFIQRFSQISCKFFPNFSKIFKTFVYMNFQNFPRILGVPPAFPFNSSKYGKTPLLDARRNINPKFE